MPFEIKPIFMLSLSEVDYNLIKEMKEYIGYGNIIKFKFSKYSPNYRDVFSLVVGGFRNCINFINIFDNILIGNKRQQYELWKQGVEIIRKDEHRTIKGILEIAKIRDKIGRKHKLKNYRDYNWFKEYLDKNYKDYKPAYYNGEN